MSIFARAAAGLRNSRFVIPIFIFVVVGFFIGCVAFYEDYISSLNGYKLLPTRKSGDEIVQIIALLPQVGQIIFFYMFGRALNEQGRMNMVRIYFLVAIVLLAFDLSTDLYFKASGMPLYVYGIALVESLAVFTVGSELLTTVCFGIAIELFPEVLDQLSAILGGLVIDDDDGRQPSGKRPQKKGEGGQQGLWESNT